MVKHTNKLHLEMGVKHISGTMKNEAGKKIVLNLLRNYPDIQLSDDKTKGGKIDCLLWFNNRRISESPLRDRLDNILKINNDFIACQYMNVNPEGIKTCTKCDGSGTTGHDARYNKFRENK